MFPKWGTNQRKYTIMAKRITPSARLLAQLREWAYALAFPVALVGGALFVLVMHASRAPL